MKYCLSGALFLMIIFFSCTPSTLHPHVPLPTDTTAKNKLPFDSSLVVGWWGSYKNGALNVPANRGYSLLYFGADSFYLQDGRPGVWTVTHDTIHIDTIASSRLSFTKVEADTLLTFTYGTISQTYVRVDMGAITSLPIETVAGGAKIVTSTYGDGGPATAATLYYPVQVGLDAMENIYVLDHLNTIRKITKATGMINRVAGRFALSGYSGDGGPALNAQIAFPTGMAVDPAGNIYFTDYNSNCVRKVTAVDGMINVIAGTPGAAAGFSGDGGPALNALFSAPSAIALDATGNIYVADQGNFRIRKISVTDGTISTVAGTGTSGVSGDGGPAVSAQVILTTMTVDAAGNIFLVDVSRIRKIAASTGIINTIAGSEISGYNGENIPALSAQFSGIANIALDPYGNIFISEQINNRVREISVSNNKVNTVAGNGGEYNGDGRHATAYGVDPMGLVSNSTGDIFIADFQNNRVRKLHGQ